MNSKKIIIGAGITGLVWKYYNPEFHIISPELPGGSYGKNYLVWLHDTPDTRRLLADLGWKNLNNLKKKSRIGYYHKGWITENQTPELSLQMIQKKMTEWDKPLDTSFIPKSKTISLTTEDSGSYMNTLDIDLTEVIEKLSKNADIENGFVTGIGNEMISVKSTLDGPAIGREYETLISTIPAPFFWKGYGDTTKTFKCLPITNIVTSVRPPLVDDRYEMIYYSDEVPYTRTSHIGGKWAIEFTGVVTKEQFEKILPGIPIDDYFVVKQGRIFNNDDNRPPQDNIIFSGRFSKWDYKVTSEHVINQAINYHEKK